MGMIELLPHFSDSIIYQSPFTEHGVWCHLGPLATEFFGEFPSRFEKYITPATVASQMFTTLRLVTFRTFHVSKNGIAESNGLWAVSTTKLSPTSSWGCHGGPSIHRTFVANLGCHFHPKFQLHMCESSCRTKPAMCKRSFFLIGSHYTFNEDGVIRIELTNIKFKLTDWKICIM